MIKTTLNWTVKNLKSMYEGKNTLQMDHVIQRQSGQWDGDKLKKSLLVHSILANYPVPPVYCLKEAVSEKDYSYSILDGKQRITTIFDYIDGRYPLDEETPSVVIDEVTYELGGKYFTDLDTECQQEILRFKFTIYGFEDADDDLIEEIFFRLNNSTPLSKPQKAMPLCGITNAKFIKSILSDRFFTEICQFSAMQRRKSDDMCTLLQAMMLLDSRYCGYEYASISADEIMAYAASIKNNYSDGQKERLFDIIDYLEKVFPEKEKMLKKINIPIVMLCADTAMGKNYDGTKNIYRVGPMYFRQWFSYFFEECYGVYKEFCSSGSIKKEKTLKRIETMEGSLKDYFELWEDTGTSGDSCLTESTETSQGTDMAENTGLSGDSDMSEDTGQTEGSSMSGNTFSVPDFSDGGIPSTDAGLTECGPATGNGREASDLREKSVYDPVAKSTDAYSPSEHTETDREEKPPEEDV